MLIQSIVENNNVSIIVVMVMSVTMKDVMMEICSMKMAVQINVRLRVNINVLEFGILH